MFDGILIFARLAQYFTKGILRIGGSWRDFHIALQGNDGLAGIGIARIKIQIPEAIEGGGETRVHLQSSFKQSPRAVIILLKEKPLAGDVEDVLVARITLQQIVHAGNGGKKMVILDVGHPANYELFIGGRAGKKSFGFGEGGGIRHAAPCGKRDQSVTEGGLRVLFRGLARQVG